MYTVNAIVMIRQSFNLLTGYGSPISLQINKIVELSTSIEFQVRGERVVSGKFPKNATVERKIWLYILSIFLLVDEFGKGYGGC